MTLRIAPSILSADVAHLARDVDTVMRGGADQVHVDVMDGHFVPNLTFGVPVVAALRKHYQDLVIDCHLMIEHPEFYIGPFRDAGATILTIHAEACRHLQRHLNVIRTAGMQCGVAINPATPLEHVQEIIAEIDLLLVMTVNPGFPAQKFWAPGIDKVRRARRMLDEAGSTAMLEVDGGVSRDTIGKLAAAGADTFVAGNGIFTAADPAAEVGALRHAAEAALLRHA